MQSARKDREAGCRRVSASERWQRYKFLCKRFASPYRHTTEYADLLQYLQIQCWRATCVYIEKPADYRANCSEHTHVYNRLGGAVRDFWKDGNNYLIHKPRGLEPIVVHQLYNADNCHVERISTLAHQHTLR